MRGAKTSETESGGEGFLSCRPTTEDVNRSCGTARGQFPKGPGNLG